MANLDAIRKLRLLCGASITSCKKALEASGGDFERALEILRKEGIEFAKKKSARETHAGVVDVYVHNDRRLGSMIAVKAETDFVARNDEFRSFVHELAMQVAATSPEDLDDLLKQAFIKDQTKTIEDYLKEMIAKFGENIEIVHYNRFEF